MDFFAAVDRVADQLDHYMAVVVNAQWWSLDLTVQELPLTTKVCVIIRVVYQLPILLVPSIEQRPSRYIQQCENDKIMQSSPEC